MNFTELNPKLNDLEYFIIFNEYGSNISLSKELYIAEKSLYSFNNVYNQFKDRGILSIADIGVGLIVKFKFNNITEESLYFLQK
jgi:hypothetical protein